ncbi:unnamed protein product [Arabidopsis lyrata]|nr:unnamed protein product [Arabidopsis lyrata]
MELQQEQQLCQFDRLDMKKIMSLLEDSSSSNNSDGGGAGDVFYAPHQIIHSSKPFGYNPNSLEEQLQGILTPVNIPETNTMNQDNAIWDGFWNMDVVDGHGGNLDVVAATAACGPRKPYFHNLIVHSQSSMENSDQMYNRKPMEKKKEGMGSIDQDLSFRKIMKDVELFGSSHMTWKDKKALENKKVTALGGKPQKNHGLPLSVARNMILGRFGGQFGSGSTRKPAERKRTLEERVLKSTVGHFKGGVLDVRHMLHSGSSRTNDTYFKMKKHSKSENREGGGKKKNKGKKKGGGKKKGK